jgi:hypothetical protein
VFVNLQKALLALVFINLGLAVFSVGFLRAVGTVDGVALGVMCALASAWAWAASTVVLNDGPQPFRGTPRRRLGRLPGNTGKSLRLAPPAATLSLAAGGTNTHT